jgi:hypothetical protein
MRTSARTVLLAKRWFQLHHQDHKNAMVPSTSQGGTTEHKAKRITLWITFAVLVVILFHKLTTNRHDEFMLANLRALSRLAVIIETINTREDVRSNALEIKEIGELLQLLRHDYLSGKLMYLDGKRRLNESQARTYSEKYRVRYFKALERISAANRALNSSVRAPLSRIMVRFSNGWGTL